LAVWSSCLWPVAVCGEELAVALSTMPDSTSSNAWLACPCQARPRHSLRPTLLRALYCTPSGVRSRARLRPLNLPPAGGSVYMIKNGSKLEIGPNTQHAGFTGRKKPGKTDQIAEEIGWGLGKLSVRENRRTNVGVGALFVRSYRSQGMGTGLHRPVCSFARRGECEEAAVMRVGRKRRPDGGVVGQAECCLCGPVAVPAFAP
jgi:hypothetical protein